MAHYAFLDQNNIVTEVIVGKNEGEENINWEQYRWDSRNIFYYINSEGEFVVRINQPYDYPPELS
jgi:hypothetical protein